MLMWACPLCYNARRYLFICCKDELHKSDKCIDHKQSCNNGLKQHDILKERHWMLHVRKACHCLFCCDRADYKWESESSIAWIELQLQEPKRFYQREYIEDRCKGEDRQQEAS